ncbi:MAG: response regulator, partial [Proteobacteria bacterium]|nr:response regulator [Pseudomonadota bacterium]
HIDYDKGGNPRNIEIHASPIFDDDGNVIQIIMNAIDITKRRQAEEKHRQLEDQLRHSQKMDSLGTLASGMAHEFNNLLHMMLGNANLIRKKLSANSPLLKNTSNIQEAGKRAADLIKQVLTFGRKDDATLSTINMTPIIKEVSQLLRSTIPTTIRIDTKIAVERGWVEGNATQIQQVIINICKNAEHAMKNCGNLEIGLDKVVLSIKQAGVLNLDPGLHLRLRIQDTGCGIPEENIERIFDPFFTTKGMEKGTGLGLSVVHGIVEKHRGSIQVESEIDKGTTVTIFFPFAETAEEKPREEVEEEYKGEGQKILFVDDEKMIVELMKSQLKALGYSVVATTDSKEALSLFKKGDFDLLITDQEMPDISGLELVEEVRKTDPDLPVILITGRSPKVDKEFMEKLGCIHVLKPVSISDTSKHIRDILKG